MNQEGQDILVQAEPLHEFATALYQKAGVSQEHAKLMADLQVETDLRSVHSHGTRMIPWYVRSILDGAMNASPDIRVVQEGPGFAVIDGDNGLGHPPSALAMQMAIEKARSTGIAAGGGTQRGPFRCRRLLHDDGGRGEDDRLLNDEHRWTVCRCAWSGGTCGYK